MGQVVTLDLTPPTIQINSVTGTKKRKKKTTGKIGREKSLQGNDVCMFLQGSLKLLILGVYHTMQIHGRFEGFPHNSALSGCGNIMTPV